jgi:hypothetical protein
MACKHWPGDATDAPPGAFSSDGLSSACPPPKLPLPTPHPPKKAFIYGRRFRLRCGDCLASLFPHPWRVLVCVHGLKLLTSGTPAARYTHGYWVWVWGAPVTEAGCSLARTSQKDCQAWAKLPPLGLAWRRITHGSDEGLLTTLLCCLFLFILITAVGKN